MLHKINVIFGITLLCLLAACKGSESNSIEIGVLESPRAYWNEFDNGAMLAVEQINQNGGVLGKPLALNKEKSAHSINSGVLIAERYSKNPSVVAVLGHFESYITMPVSQIYEAAGKVMITPGSTSNRITKQGYQFVFRMIPSNKDIGRFIANYISTEDFKRILIFYIRDEYGIDLAYEIEKAAFAHGVDVVDRRSYIDQGAKYTNLLEFWKTNYTFDGMVVLGALPEGAEIVNQIRDVGIDVPIISADTFNNQLLIDVAKENAEGVVFATFSTDKNTSQNYQQFASAYEKKYKEPPSESAMLGYDGVYLVAYAIKSAGSTDPKQVANFLREMPKLNGVLGSYQFDEKGNLIIKDQLHLTKVKDKKFVNIDSEIK